MREFFIANMGKIFLASCVLDLFIDTFIVVKVGKFVKRKIEEYRKKNLEEDENSRYDD